MSKNKGQSLHQTSEVQSAALRTPGSPISELGANHANGCDPRNSIDDSYRLLMKARCERYAEGLYEGGVTPPDIPSPELEAGAIQADLTAFRHPYDHPHWEPPLPQDQAKELEELRCRAIRAMKVRLRQLESDQEDREQNGRPALPARGCCLVPPKQLRWEGEVEVQQRLWHLLGMVFDAGDEAVSFEAIQENIHHDRPIANKTIVNKIHALNKHLLDIRFPWGIKSKGAHLMRKPEGP